MSADTSTAPAVTFTPGEIPTQASKRSAAPNPYLAAVAGQTLGEGSLTFTVPTGTGEEKGNAQRKAIRQLRDAAKLSDRTVRTAVKGEDTDTTSITFWSVKRVERKPAADPTASTETVVDPAAVTA